MGIVRGTKNVSGVHAHTAGGAEYIALWIGALAKPGRSRSERVWGLLVVAAFFDCEARKRRSSHTIRKAAGFCACFAPDEEEIARNANVDLETGTLVGCEVLHVRLREQRQAYQPLIVATTVGSQCRAHRAKRPNYLPRASRSA